MREIKFRAWDKEKKGWIEPHYVDISCAGIISEVTVHRGYEINRERNVANLILMQFIGLKDKNGKEIYEGGIFEKNGLIQHVHWNRLNASFYLQPRHLTKNFDDKIGRYGFDEIELFKIIGNIYENPELIK